MDCSPSRSSVHGILWATIFEWVAISYFRLYRCVCMYACVLHTLESVCTSIPVNIYVGRLRQTLGASGVCVDIIPENTIFHIPPEQAINPFLAL